MKIDRREPGRYYASVSDEELLSLDPDELTETAQVIRGLEIMRRGLGKKPLDLEKPEVIASSIESPAPDWHQDSVLACCFDVSHGDAAAEKAARAQGVLHHKGFSLFFHLAGTCCFSSLNSSGLYRSWEGWKRLLLPVISFQKLYYFSMPPALCYLQSGKSFSIYLHLGIYFRSGTE